VRNCFLDSLVSSVGLTFMPTVFGSEVIIAEEGTKCKDYDASL